MILLFLRLVGALLIIGALFPFFVQHKAIMNYYEHIAATGASSSSSLDVSSSATAVAAAVEATTSVPLFLERALLTTAVDNASAVQTNASFGHTILPRWVQYRYIDFEDQQDLPYKDDNSSHLLLVSRTNNKALSDYVWESVDRWNWLSRPCRN